MQISEPEKPDQPEIRLVKTIDGSDTLFVPELNEHYHSTHGAVQESEHVYIKTGLQEILKSKTDIRILEMGFGTGLNTILTYMDGLKKDINIHYTGLEAFPLDAELVLQLNYPQFLPDETISQVFSQMHLAPWNETLELKYGADKTASFNLLKKHISLLDFRSDIPFDLVYFDAFAPEVQPELWTPEIFDKMFALMNPGGILATYCCKGNVKRAMIEAGFSIEKLPGPPGKREIIRAMRP